MCMSVLVCISEKIRRNVSACLSLSYIYLSVWEIGCFLMCVSLCMCTESVHVHVHVGLRVECQRWQRPVYAADGGTGSCQSPD